jgi:hypothetical protein
MQFVPQEMSTLLTTVTVKDSKVEYLGIAKCAVGGHWLVRPLLDAPRRTFGKGRDVDNACLICILVVRATTSYAGGAKVVLRATQRNAHDRQFSCGHVRQ